MEKIKSTFYSFLGLILRAVFTGLLSVAIINFILNLKP